MAHEDGEECLVDESGFTGARNTGDADEETQWNVNVDGFQVVS